MPAAADDPLIGLERWYLAQCNGEWEHSYGVKLHTLDNPGWHLEIDLAGTSLDGKAYPAVDIEWAGDDWVNSRVEEDGRFHAYCGPTNLWGVVKAFLAWAEDANTGS